MVGSLPNTGEYVRRKVEMMTPQLLKVLLIQTHEAWQPQNEAETSVRTPPVDLAG
jgi:hypothetical protein